MSDASRYWIALIFGAGAGILLTLAAMLRPKVRAFLRNAAGDEKERQDREERRQFFFYSIIAAIVVSVLWLIVGLVPWWIYGHQDAEQFGSSFNFVTAWFSGLAFAGVIIAIILPTRELQYQRRELQESQDAWRDSARAQQKSEEALREQAKWLFAGPYLNAMLSVRDRPKPEECTPDQWTAYVQLQAIVESLQPRAAALLDIKPSRSRWLSTSLANLAGHFNASWMASVMNRPDGFRKGNELCRGLAMALREVTRHADHPHVLSRLNDLANQLTEFGGTGGGAGDERQRAQLLANYGGEGLQIASDLQALSQLVKTLEDQQSGAT